MARRRKQTLWQRFVAGFKDFIREDDPVARRRSAAGRKGHVTRRLNKEKKAREQVWRVGPDLEPTPGQPDGLSDKTAIRFEPDPRD